MNYEKLIEDILFSWHTMDGIYSVEQILNFVKEKNESLHVSIERTLLTKTKNRFINEDGLLRNNNNSFFQVDGFERYNDNFKVNQPIIIQNEIGYLGIICSEINGVLHFLMQAKIEPGNINKIQISPTIQATKSNFQQKHGGAKPHYLEYFENKDKYFVLIDQLQSEQGQRFFKKRNRNIIIYVPYDEVKLEKNYIWMTLGQIKKLLRIDNLVNMDTRTVLSCIPFCFYRKNFFKARSFFNNNYLFNSVFNNDVPETTKAFEILNDFKMYNQSFYRFLSLNKLAGRNVNDYEISPINCGNFKVIFCNIEIEGREVKSRSQPLFSSLGKGLFVLFVAKFGDKYKFLVKAQSEVGTFDEAEFSPTIQYETEEIKNMPFNVIDKIFTKHVNDRAGILYDVILSEEGGRFYQEENRNMIIEINKDELQNIDKNFVWLDFKTLNFLNLQNNVLNIQLRNLLSLWEI